MSLKRILIADDEPSFISMLRMRLERDGFEIDEVYNGSEVPNRLNENNYDLVLLDYVMPGMRGDEICRELRGVEKLKQLPVIIVTAYSNREEDYFKGEGATDVIFKPLEYEDLITKIKRYVSTE